jgi:general secretion pathway protein G
MMFSTKMKLSIFKKNLRGFTLIELLIVIAIISILISIGLASARKVQEQSRDRQRQTDTKNIGGALELYYSDHDEYPGDPSALVPNYINSIPHDPLDSTANVYDSYVLPSGQAYCLIVDLEITPQAADLMDCPANGSTGHDYVVSSRD